MLEKIDASELPVYWGGTRTDPDGDIHCRSKVSKVTRIYIYILKDLEKLKKGIFKYTPIISLGTAISQFLILYMREYQLLL